MAVRRRTRRRYSRKKQITVPLLSTGAGLAIFTALNGNAALNNILTGKVGDAINNITQAAQSPEAKAKVIGTIGATMVGKMLMKGMGRQVGKLGPLVFTSG